MPGNNLVASYEVDYKLLKTTIDQKLDAMRELYGEPRKAVVREIERAIDDTDEILAQISEEGRALQGGQRGRARVRLKGYVREMDAARRALVEARAMVPERRRGGNFDQEDSVAADAWSRERAKDWRKTAGSEGDVDSGILGGGSGGGRVEGRHGCQVESVRTVESGYVESAYAGDGEGRLGALRSLATRRRVTVAVTAILGMFLLLNVLSKFS